jgi:ribosome maturation factor RimP
LENIKKILLPFLEEKGYKLYEMKFVTEFGEKILRIIVDKEDGITVDELAEVNEYLSERIDDSISDSAYMLEVSSRGAEREFDFDELDKMIDKYVMIKTDKENFGYIREIKEDEIILEMNIKGAIRKRPIKKNEINKMRLSVKF